MPDPVSPSIQRGRRNPPVASTGEVELSAGSLILSLPIGHSESGHPLTWPAEHSRSEEIGINRAHPHDVDAVAACLGRLGTKRLFVFVIAGRS